MRIFPGFHPLLCIVALVSLPTLSAGDGCLDKEIPSLVARTGGGFVFGDRRLTISLDADFLLQNVTTCDPTTGRGQGMLDGDRMPPMAGVPWWSVNLTTPPCRGLPAGTEVGPQHASTRTWDFSVSADGLATLTLQYRNLTAGNASISADVNITVTMGGLGASEGEAAFRFKVSPHGGAGTHSPYCVTAMSFPLLNPLVLRDTRDQLFVPHFFGHVGDLSQACGGGDCTLSMAKTSVMRGEHALMPNGNERSMQFMAAYSNRSGQSLGVYLGSHDTKGRLQQLLAEGGYDSRPRHSFAAVRWLHFPVDIADSTGVYQVTPHLIFKYDVKYL